VAFETAQRALGPIDRISEQLKPYLNRSPVLARRHYIETGTLRHFEVRYAEVAALSEAAARVTEGDGLVVVALCESREECRSADAFAASPAASLRPEVLVAVPPPLRDLSAELQDVRCWQWVADNTPELAHDTYAAVEVARQMMASRRALQGRLASQAGIRGADPSVRWWRGGKECAMPTRGGLSGALSTLCDELYDDAPHVRNELLNRRALSSAAAAARMRLIERMFSAASKPALGFESGKAPPEKSMYLSVLSAGNAHRQEAGQFLLAVPPEGADPLRLRPALMGIVDLLEQSDGHRVSASRIFDVLQDRPYGVRTGVAPLLLALVTLAFAHRIAVYENGTFAAHFQASDFLRLTKQPTAFEFQWCRVEGIRADVFARLAQVFVTDWPEGRNPELLDVVRSLSTFAAGLPEYTRHHRNLPELPRRVRDTLLSAREPATLIFSALPVACGLEPFSSSDLGDPGRAQQFIDSLREALSDLSATYPQLLESIRKHVYRGLADGGKDDRATISERASRVLLAARAPRLQVYARCLADTVLSDDAWAEKLGSFIISRPPARWTTVDETRALDDLDVLTATFRRVEAIAFDGNANMPDVSAMRVMLTHGDGSEEAVLVRIRSEDERQLQALVAKLQAVLADSGELGLAALARLLGSSMPGNGELH
jgi:hypothetical protein